MFDPIFNPEVFGTRRNHSHPFIRLYGTIHTRGCQSRLFLFNFTASRSPALNLMKQRHAKIKAPLKCIKGNHVLSACTWEGFVALFELRKPAQRKRRYRRFRFEIASILRINHQFYVLTDHIIQSIARAGIASFLASYTNWICQNVNAEK